VISGDRKFHGLKENIRLEHLTFAFPDRNPVLKDISLTIESGRTTVIIGATGSGKTTLGNLLLRLYSAPAGQIFFDRTDINEFNRESLVSRMAVVSQEVYLFDDTIKNNVTYGLDNIPDDRIWDIFKKIGFSDFVSGQPKKLDTLVGEKGTRLSGGQKQLLVLARALLKDFDILILDEATSFLDMKTEDRVQKTIEEMTRGKTVIVIAHRLASIRRAEKVVVLESGCLLEAGAPAELLKHRGKFFEYFESQKICFPEEC
jgi:ABC-type multidrug transport system fused ATPase/permease subunit